MNRVDPGALDIALFAVLDEAITIGSARSGHIQLLDPVRVVLALRVQRGFDAAFVEKFREVRADDGSAGARALRYRRRVAIGDVMQDAAFAPFAASALEAGFQAVQSTPIVARDGRLLGVLSTHFPLPQLPSLSEGIMLDHSASRAAAIIERYGAAG